MNKERTSFKILYNDTWMLESIKAVMIIINTFIVSYARFSFMFNVSTKFSIENGLAKNVIAYCHILLKSSLELVELVATLAIICHTWKHIFLRGTYGPTLIGVLLTYSHMLCTCSVFSFFFSSLYIYSIVLYFKLRVKINFGVSTLSSCSKTYSAIK